MTKIIVSILVISLFVACGSNESNDNEPCTKQIIVQNEFIIQTASGTTIIPQITQEVDCNFPDPEIAEVITELPRLSSFSYNVLNISIIPDTGNNTSKVSYQIQLNNLSDKAVKGLPYVTTRINNQSITSSQVNNSSCTEISANSSCTISFEAEDSLNLGTISSYDVVNVEYFVFE